jgi:hypothetical protein
MVVEKMLYFTTINGKVLDAYYILTSDKKKLIDDFNHNMYIIGAYQRGPIFISSEYLVDINVINIRQVEFFINNFSNYYNEAIKIANKKQRNKLIDEIILS